MFKILLGTYCDVHFFLDFPRKAAINTYHGRGAHIVWCGLANYLIDFRYMLDVPDRRDRQIHETKNRVTGVGLKMKEEEMMGLMEKQEDHAHSSIAC